MAKIKIYCIHPMFTNIEQLNRFFRIPEKHNLIWDEIQPDYIIASEWIYKDKQLYQKFLSLQNDKVINIFFAGECIAPDLNFFDYAIVFDRNLSDSDRIVRIPTIDFFQAYLTKNFFSPCQNPKLELQYKTKFCNFIYTNANAHKRRDELFYKLSEYKKVDALGTHLRNVDVKERYVDEAIKRNYKFTIACENAVYKGYTSEKLLTAMQAYTIPIYFGDPSVAESFNPKRFINTNNMELDEILEKVKEIDNDDELYCKMLSEPVMTSEQEEKYKLEHQIYLKFWDNIFSYPLEKAKRIGFRTYPNMYRKFMTDLINTANITSSKDKEFLGGIIKKKIKGSKRIIKFFGIKIFSYNRKPVK